jgi:hypothetical protein
LLLAKHTPGQPLSEAEHRQRREAARARWAAAGKTAAIGAVGGGLIGGFRGAILSGGSERAASLAASAEGLRQAYVARAAEEARRRDKRDVVQRFYERQMRQTPEAEAQTTLAEAIESLRNPYARAQRPARRPVREPPIVGNTTNHLVYTRLVWKAERNLKLARNKIEALVRANMAAGDDREAAEAEPTVRRLRVELASTERELKDLKRLRDRAATIQSRAEHTRTPTRRRGKEIAEPKTQRVKANVVRQTRGGEKEEIEAGRGRTERADLRAELERRLAQHDIKTERFKAAAERRTITETAEAVRQNLLSGHYHSQILRRAGRGALIGAVAGLTTAGVALLAHHVATAGRRRATAVHNPVGPVHKTGDLPHNPGMSLFAPSFEGPKSDMLAKAEPPRDTPEGQMGPDLAGVYRRWIDRLLGHGDDPVNIGDGLVEALGPGITEAFAQGLITPPITGPEHPDYRIDVDFDLLNPAQLRHIAEYSLDRIVELTDAQRETIRDALREQSVLQGIGPKDVARTIKEAIGLTTYQRGVVASFRRQLEQLDPRALERQLRDKRYDRTLSAAIAANTPLSAEQIDTMVDAYHRKMLALRSQTIARTEALRATSYGGLARAQEVLDRHPELEVTKKWLATEDNRTRPTHRDLDGREVDGMLGHFVTSAGHPIRWPLDETAPADEVINCRCTLRYIFKPKRGQQLAVNA